MAHAQVPMKPTVIFGLILAAAMTVPLIGAAATPAYSSDADEALYLKRLAAVGVQGSMRYDPLEAIPGAAKPHPLPMASSPGLPQAVLDKAGAYALANNSKALLIWRDGALQSAVYGPGVDASTLLNSKSMAKPLGAIAAGRAIALGALKSLDEPAADFITEWRGTPKAAITIRELLSMTSGLAEQGPVKDPASIWSRSYLHPRHEAVMIQEYPLTAPPGTRFQYANVSAEMIAAVIERATKRRYAEFLSDEILKPLGAAGGAVWVDHPGGLAHSGCCTQLPAETWLRLGLLLMNDGVWVGRRLLPEGYVTAMKTPSVGNPRYGLGIWIPGDYIVRRGFGRPDQMLGAVFHSEPYLAKDLFLFDGLDDQVLYIVPSQKLAILRMGDAPPRAPEWDNAFLPNLVLRALAQP
jgi:CubicO group peptidase (beta-lactamase class C family)